LEVELLLVSVTVLVKAEVVEVIGLTMGEDLEELKVVVRVAALVMC
jgi:hypothetical protein